MRLARNLPHELHPPLDSGILLSALVAAGLNAFFNGVGSAEKAQAEAAVSSAAEHV